MVFFFFNDTATTEIYTLSLHDALPICAGVTARFPCGLTAVTVQRSRLATPNARSLRRVAMRSPAPIRRPARSEEHTSELQSRQYLVCRLLLEKKKKNIDCNDSTALSHE